MIGTSKKVYTLGVVGDSRLANSYVSPSPGNGAKSKAFQNQMTVAWLRALSLQRVDLLLSAQLATSGANTTQILAQAVAMSALSVKPDFCLINGGTNDFASSATTAAANLAFSNITSAAILLRNSGIVPVIEVDVPRTTASWTATAGVISSQFNRMLRLWCQDNDILLSDIEASYTIPSTGEPASGYNLSDGIHSTCTGSTVRALSFLRCIDSLLLPSTTRMASIRDQYDATNNPRGNMLANGRFGGTGGTNTGTGTSGAVADNWQSKQIAGTLTAVASKVAPVSLGEFSDIQRVVINFSSAGCEYRLQPTGVGGGSTLPTGLVAGDLIYSECDVTITACSGAIRSVNLALFDFDGSANISTVIDMTANLSSGNPMPAVPLPAANGAGNLTTTLPLRLKTPTMIYADGATPTQLNCRLTVTGDSGGSITIDVSNFQLRKV